MAKKTVDAPAAAATLLNLSCSNAKQVGGRKHEHAHLFIPLVGEIQIQFKNFSSKPKFFIFSVQECDESGNPLAEPVKEIIKTISSQEELDKI